MYKCIKSDFIKLEKKINTLIKKLKKYNLDYNFEIIGENIEEVIIPDTQGNILKTIFLDVVEYQFTMDTIKLGNFNVVAVLKHNQIDNSNENVIYMIDTEVNLPEKYKTTEAYCDHCSTNRKRNTTVILENLDNKNNFIQVGVSCLKEYTGIDDVDVIKDIMNLQDLLIEDLSLIGPINSYNPYVKTLDYLAQSIYLIENDGYIKELTRDKAFDNTLRGLSVKSEYVEKAKQTLEFFENNNFANNNFLRNTKLFLQNEYSRSSGFIAYAYVAYQNMSNTKTEPELISEYVGNIGERIEITVSLKNRFTFQTMYGIQNIYLFQDKIGNIYKWKTGVYLVDKEGNSIELSQEDIKLKGTIKGHNEYNNVKQTELSRCKILS